MTSLRYRTVRRLAAATLVVTSGFALLSPASAQPKPADPANHAAHTTHAPSTTAPATAPAKPSLAAQVTELRSKVAQLEAALQRRQVGQGGAATSGMSGTGAAAAVGGASMPGMAPAPGGGSMQMGATASSGGAAPMMGDMMGEMGSMMQRMGGMMKMEMGGMSSGGSAGMGSMGGMPAGGSSTNGMSGMTPAPAMKNSGSGTSGMMGMDDMMGMMGMPPTPAMTASALPGFPGASHLYHIGADDFFLNHDQHITLTPEQRTALTQARERSVLAKATSDRKVAQAEQELWQLTAADQPDATKVEAKVREIEKLRGDDRLSFVRAVGEAAKLLTPEQTKQLLGQLPPVMPQPAPASSPAPGMGGGGMGDM